MKPTAALGLSLLLLVTLPSPSPSDSCKRTPQPHQSSTTSYRFRKNDDRCEGTRSRPVSGGLSLAGLYIGQLPTKPQANDLSLRVPRLLNTPQPKIFVNALKDNYQLEPLQLTPESSGFYKFRWAKGVLERSQIPFNTLRARAYLEQSPRIYLPVVLGPNRQYTIALYASTPILLKRFAILQNGRTIKQFSTPSVDEEVIVSWDGKAPAGQYQLVIEPEDPAMRPINLTFSHNPQWLR